MDSFCDRVCFEKIVAAYKRDAIDDTALARTVWPCKNRKKRHALRGGFVQFSKHFVVLIAGSAIEEPDFEFSPGWLFHNVDL